MGRGWKIACGVVLALIALLLINAFLVDGETRSAAVTVPGGRILNLSGGDVQVAEGGPRGGSPIVLIHCFTCAIDWWDAARPALEQDHRVIAVDLLGHGGSEKPEHGYDVVSQADLVANAMEDLDVRAAAIVGHSLGGAVAVALAERTPDAVKQVVIIDTPPVPDGDLGLVAKLAFAPVIGEAGWQLKTDSLVRDGLSVAFAPGFDVPDAFVDDVNRMTFTAYDESGSEFDDYTGSQSLDERMAATGKPLLVLMGSEEQIIDDPSNALAEYKRGVPNARTRLITGAGHSPNVERPTLVDRLILEFAK
ncbi:MAG: alpha/beta fold hydrolase [Thermoleophilia bacterium]|nr:alpha/beta fold hydrolase [Thermoleophilia bacterium]